MRTILLDENLEGYGDYLERLLFGPTWRDISLSLSLRLVDLSNVGLRKGASDEQIWDLCQREHYFLLTDNRNEDDADSLGAMIQTRNLPESMPVFTVSDLDRFRLEVEYAEAVAVKLLEYLADADNLCGTGRLYLP